MIDALIDTPGRSVSWVARQVALGWLDLAEKSKKRPRPDDGNGRDPLGKPLARYSTTLKAAMLVAVAAVLGLSGGAVLGASRALARSLAESEEDTAYAVVAWGLILVGMPIIAYGVYGRT